MVKLVVALLKEPRKAKLLVGMFGYDYSATVNDFCFRLQLLRRRSKPFSPRDSLNSAINYRYFLSVMQVQ
jgi:hypothetical protein